MSPRVALNNFTTSCRDIGEFAYSNSFDIEVSPMGSGHGSSVEKPPRKPQR